MSKKRYSSALILVMGLVGLLVVPAAGTQNPDGDYESYFLYLGDHPDQESPGWHNSVQGITHDNDHWYITQKTRLWKIPVEHDLSDDAGEVYLGWVLHHAPGVYTVTIRSMPKLSEVPELSDEGYNHFGDLTYHQGYLLVPLEGAQPPAIAVFRAANVGEGDNKGYVGRVHLADEQEKAAWAAVDPEGYVYSSASNDVCELTRYKLDWSALPQEVKFADEDQATKIPLFDKNGSPLCMHFIQGGVFSTSGHLLYLVSGYCDQHYANDGINVFETRTWRRITRSTNGAMPFAFRFHPAEHLGGCTGDEPEGITIFDGAAPGIEGQLHVLVRDNNWTSGDTISLKHYTEAINVDAAYSGAKDGTPDRPFNTVGEAHEQAWDGSRIKIKQGSYPESVTLSKRIMVQAVDGIVTLGE